MRRSTLAAVAVAISIVLLSADAFAGAVATPVRTDPDRVEFEGSGNANYFAWTQDQADAYFQRDVWVLPTGGQKYEVRAGGGQAVSGQMDHTGSLLPYHHCVHNASCDIVLFDMSTAAPRRHQHEHQARDRPRSLRGSDDVLPSGRPCEHALSRH